MLQDCMQDNRLFGITYHPDSAVGKLVAPVVDSIGCAAHIMSVVPLEEEQSSILVAGLCRYRTLEYSDQEPYLVARIEFFEDDPAEAIVSADTVSEVSDMFLRYLKAMRTLKDEPSAQVALPDDPEQLSFAIAAAILSEAEQQLEVLQMSSTAERFDYLSGALSAILDEVESRAAEHMELRKNGRRKSGLK
jgi:ATP-dependent Lon protease